MNTYYVGWDVGALYCQDRSKSHDALCILGEGPEVLWSYDKAIPVSKMLKSSNNGIIGFLNNVLEPSTNQSIINKGDKLIIAIDGVFRWPSALEDIFNKELDIGIATANDAISNRYLYRITEKFVKEKMIERNKKKQDGIFKQGKTNNPFSVVQNSIGSQSIKVMCFLQIFKFQQSQRIGVWEDPNGNLAIETYPSVVNNTKGDTDWQDAYICASLAKMFSKQETKEKQLFDPPQNLDPETLREEGWIWFPKEPVELLNKI